MAQSPELTTEVGVMRKIEAAFEAAKQLPERQRARVLRWAREEHLSEAEAETK